MGSAHKMNCIISFLQSSLPSGTTKADFDNGTVTASDGTVYRMTGSNHNIESTTIMTSVATVLYLEGDMDCVVYLPANKYVRIKTNIESMKIVSSASYDLWFTASTEPTGSPEVS